MPGNCKRSQLVIDDVPIDFDGLAGRPFGITKMRPSAISICM